MPEAASSAPVLAATAQPERAPSANNFDAVRMVAALLVILSHQYALTGHAEATPLPFATWGFLGVLVFFVTSGHLVTQSWCQDPSPARFLQRRALRIWPALAVATLLTLFVLGPLTTQGSLKAYFSSAETWWYGLNLVFLIQQTLPGVFLHNPFARAVNGSLWTIPYEVLWYAVLAVLGTLGMLARRWPMVVLAGLGLACMTWVVHQPGPMMRVWVLELGCFFVAGSLLYLYRRIWQAHPWWTLLVIALGCGALFAVKQLYLATWLALPVLTVMAGRASWPVLRHAGRWGDPSYGLYIYAFPVQQTLVMLLGEEQGVWPLLALSTACTLVLAYASWHVVEKPLLRRKPHRPTQPA